MTYLSEQKPYLSEQMANSYEQMANSPKQITCLSEQDLFFFQLAFPCRRTSIILNEQSKFDSHSYKRDQVLKIFCYVEQGLCHVSVYNGLVKL